MLAFLWLSLLSGLRGMGFKCGKRPPLPCRVSGKDETPDLDCGLSGVPPESSAPRQGAGAPGARWQAPKVLGSHLPHFPLGPGAGSRSERLCEGDPRFPSQG